MTTENALPGEMESPRLGSAAGNEPTTLNSATNTSVPTARVRHLGVDFARALALLGMMAAHFGASTEFGKSFWDSVGAITHGRSYILFVLLAGVSISLAHGGHTKLSPHKVVTARTKLLVRAVCIAILGSALTTFSSDIIVILPTYAAMFVIAIFFLTVESRTILQWGGVLMLIGGFLSALAWFLSYAFYVPIPFPEIVGGYAYPLLPLTGVLLVGMVVGRTQLSSIKNHVRMLLIGSAVALIAYSSTMLAPHPLDSSSDVPSSSSESSATDSGEALGKYEEYDEYGNPLDEDWQEGAFLDFVDQVSYFGHADPHSGSPAEMFGGTGIALGVLAVCLLIFTLGKRVAELILRPLVAMGSMPLTIYVFHVFTHGLFEFLPEEFNGGAWVLTVLVSVAFAGLWKQRFARGPLEACITKLANWFITAPNITRQ